MGMAYEIRKVKVVWELEYLQTDVAWCCSQTSWNSMLIAIVTIIYLEETKRKDGFQKLKCSKLLTRVTKMRNCVLVFGMGIELH
jgi:hypothetical protein